jgi:D-sedoheptulose 7-phosphate isomerase
MNTPDSFSSGMQEHQGVLSACMESSELQNSWSQWVEKAIQLYQASGKMFFCGNGGSAADAQHLSAELSGRFERNRAPLYAEALHVNSSYLTAVANDYGYDTIYERAVEAFMQPGDLLVAMSTSGRSPNILRAAEKARDLDITIVSLTGQTASPLSELSDITLSVPATNTARIQEMHMLLGHLFCQTVERQLFPDAKS